MRKDQSSGTPIVSHLGAIKVWVINRGGVEDTRLEAKAKTKAKKKIRGQGQGQPFRGQTLSKPRTGMLEAKDQGHKRKCSPTKKWSSKSFQAISYSQVYSGFLILGDLNHKSHAMTSSKIFNRESFCRTKISWDGRSEIVACWLLSRILQKERASTSS